MKNITNKPIAEQKWEKVTINQVYHSFLKSEFEKSISMFQQCAEANRDMINNPDFNNDFQNCIRAMLLSPRLPLLYQIPSSTVWYKVSSLNQFHLAELAVIGNCGWDSNSDQNELIEVSKRKQEKLISTPDNWDPPILWGHKKSGPFTIIEGNHRLVALASSKIKFNIPTYIGLSLDNCIWHLQDS